MTRNPTPNKFRDIRQAAEQALEGLALADDNARQGMGAVNWGDLGVVEVLFCIDEAGEARWRVLIEEAAPECGIPAVVYKRLATLFPTELFDVATEW